MVGFGRYGTLTLEQEVLEDALRANEVRYARGEIDLPEYQAGIDKARAEYWAKYQRQQQQQARRNPMYQTLTPVTFYSANGDETATRFRGFSDGAMNLAGAEVWMDLDTLFAVIKDDVARYGSTLADWAPTLALFEDERYVATMGEEPLYLVPDCAFVTEPVEGY